MARKPRNYYQSEFYHIMLRGIGHMVLFIDERDMKRFIETMIRYKSGKNMEVHAFCLMDNHVHIILSGNMEQVSLYFKQVEVSYSYYFNHKYEHVGHLFQNRFKSEPIKDDGHFISALRYVLYNPEKAGLGSWQNYRWSSAASYRKGKNDELTDTGFAISMFGSREALIEFLMNPMEQENALAEPVNRKYGLSDSQALQMIKKECDDYSVSCLQKLNKKERNVCLKRIRKKGVSVRQLERLTGINRNIIQRAK